MKKKLKSQFGNSINFFTFDALSYCLLAEGKIDVVIEDNLKPYDILPLIPIIKNSGGIITNWKNKSADKGGNILATSNKLLHSHILKVIRYMRTFKEAKKFLKDNSHSWLVTGVAGFIGSNILEQLLKLNQKVVGIDNFSTGRSINLEEVKNTVNHIEWSNFKMIEGDISNSDICLDGCKNIDFVFPSS